LNNSDIQEKVINIKCQLSEYNLHDQYNMNEISLFFNISPDSTIAQEVVESNKKDKVQITVAFTCNADSTDHFESMFIRHANKSQSFNRKTGKELGFFYHYNKKV